VCVFLLLFADESLDEVEHFVDIVANYGDGLKADEQQQIAGSGELTVGQQVLARSSVNGGHWRYAVVLPTAHR